MFEFFLKNFKVEVLALGICLAVSVGMIVQQVPALGVSSSSIGSATLRRIQTECQANFEQIRTWVMTNGARLTDTDWQAGETKYNEWVTYCQKQLGSYQPFYSISALRYQFKMQQPATPPQPPPQEEKDRKDCADNMERYRQWFSSNRKSAPESRLAQMRYEFQSWTTHCSSRVSGWVVPADIQKLVLQ